MYIQYSTRRKEVSLIERCPLCRVSCIRCSLFRVSIYEVPLNVNFTAIQHWSIKKERGEEEGRINNKPIGFDCDGERLVDPRADSGCPVVSLLTLCLPAYTSCQIPAGQLLQQCVVMLCLTGGVCVCPRQMINWSLYKWLAVLVIGDKALCMYNKSHEV